MQLKVCHREVELSKHRGGPSVCASLHNLLVQVVGEYFIRFPMLCEAAKSFLVISPMLIELGRGFHSIPFNVINAGDPVGVDLGQN